MEFDLDQAIVALIPAIIKARPRDASGRRIVEVEASTEEVDADGDVVLQSALLNSAANFVARGHLDIDHYSEFGHRIGIPDPTSYIIGRPLEVKALAGNRTSVVGEITRAIDGEHNPQRNRFDEFWASLERNPPVLWYSSIFGYPTAFDDCASNDGACGMMGATRFVIKAIDWRSLAFTRTPKNTALSSPARIMTAKSFMADFAKGMNPMSGTPLGLEFSAARLPGDGSRERPIVVTLPHHLAEAAGRTHLSPSEAQIAAGNYPKGHAVIGGIDVSIETPMGAMRHGKAPDGAEWHVRMPADYGYAKRTTGADGDHVDVYLGSQCHRAHECPVWVVDQINADDRTFDEHKALVGFQDVNAARQAYYDAFSDGRGPERAGAVTRMPFEGFKSWLMNGNLTQPLKYRQPIDAVKSPEPAAQQVPPNGAYPMTMGEVWNQRQCIGCGVHKAPSLLGYREHFTKCCGFPGGIADVISHAVMHRTHMMDNPFLAPGHTMPVGGEV